MFPTRSKDRKMKNGIKRGHRSVCRATHRRPSSPLTVTSVVLWMKGVRAASCVHPRDHPEPRLLQMTCRLLEGRRDVTCDEQSLTARAAHGLMLAVKLKGGLGSGGGIEGGTAVQRNIRPAVSQAVCVQPVLNEKHQLVCLMTK